MNYSTTFAGDDQTQVSAAAPLILHVFSTFKVGGPQRRFAAMANHFGSRYRHRVIALDDRTEAQTLLKTACLVQPAPFRRSNPVSDMIRAQKFLRKLKPDLLVTYNWGAMEWAAANLIAGMRHIHIEDGFGPEEAERQLPRRVWFRRAVLNRRSTLVLPSQTLVNIATKIWHIQSKRIVYVPNGVPCARFQIAHETALTFPGSGPVIGTVAALRREKALGRLIEAFTLLRTKRAARLVIVGDGPEKASLEQLTYARGVQESVFFTGPLERPERAVAGFDIFALSSDTEQMPLSVLEAMAAGLPVAGTNVGDMRHIVAEDNHPFIVPRDVLALAGSMRELVDDADARVKVGAANRARALREFDEAVMFAAYDRLFASA